MPKALWDEKIPDLKKPHAYKTELANIDIELQCWLDSIGCITPLVEYKKRAHSKRRTEKARTNEAKNSMDLTL